MENIERDGRTTIMLRNIPNKYTRDMIMEEIDAYNFRKKYDFFYLPIDYRVYYCLSSRTSAMLAMLSLTLYTPNSSQNFTNTFT